MTQLGDIPANVDVAVSNDVWPAGTIAWYIGATAPAGWQICDGAAAATTALSSVVGANVPYLIGRALVGRDSSYTALLGTRGAITHNHSSAGLTGTSHSHGVGGYYMGDHGHGHNFGINSHSHGMDTHTANTTVGDADSNRHYENWLGATSTGGGNGGVGGGIGGTGNYALSGGSSGTEPGYYGVTGDTTVPHQVGQWIIKT